MTNLSEIPHEFSHDVATKHGIQYQVQIAWALKFMLLQTDCFISLKYTVSLKLAIRQWQMYWKRSPSLAQVYNVNGKLILYINKNSVALFESWCTASTQ